MKSRENLMKSKKKVYLIFLVAVMMLCTVLTLHVSAANISRKTAAITVGKSVRLSVNGIQSGKKVKWSTSKKNVAAIKAKGTSVTVTGKRAGSAVITGKVGAKKYSCRVKVEPKIKLAIALSYVPSSGIARDMKNLGAGVYAVNEKSNISKYDGLILPGGGDINPSRYNEKKKGSKNISNKLDNLQFTVLGKFVEAKKPVLGICRGSQVINVYFGGSMNQDIKQHMGTNHPTTITKGSMVYRVYGTKLQVNSFHHQSVKRLGKGLRIVQRAGDGTVEGIEHTTLPVYGLQWHPEAMGASGRKILKKFLKVCEAHQS